MASLNLQINTRQGQMLSPRFQHAVRLLQLSSMDFADTVRDVLGQNPFLELEDGLAEGEGVVAELVSAGSAIARIPAGVRGTPVPASVTCRGVDLARLGA